METGTTSFMDRMALTKRLDEQLVPFLEKHKFQVSDFGHPVISHDNKVLANRIRQQKYKKSREMLFVKYSPDFIAIPPDSGGQPFFLDTKSSITPVFFNAHIERIRQSAGLESLSREDIFEIEREAWDNYNEIYPPAQVALVIATPYNPHLLLAEWVANLKTLFRFNEDHNIHAGGSGTPHVNINLGSMRPLSKFLQDEFDMTIRPMEYEKVLDYIKLWPLNKPQGRVNWTQFNNVVSQLRQTCPWLEYRNEPKGWKPPGERHK